MKGSAGKAFVLRNWCALRDFQTFQSWTYRSKKGAQDAANIVSRDPDTGLIDQGIYRCMYRSKNETNIDMPNDSHIGRI